MKTNTVPKKQANGSADTSAIKGLLVRPIAFHPVLARLCGSVTAGLMLSQAIYWSDKTDDSGWFYKTQVEWESEITLTRTEQEGARKRLRGFDFWQEEKRGAPALLFYRVDLDLLAVALSQFAGNLQPRMQETDNLKCGKPALQVAGNPQTLYGTETTTETTTEKPLSTSKKQEVDDPLLPLKNRIRDYIHKVQLAKTGIKSAWNGSEGRLLASMVRENPSWTEADWQRMLRNWSKSDPQLVRHGDRARQWLNNISRFSTGPVLSFAKQKKAAGEVLAARSGTNADEVIATLYRND